ncbi:MAG: CPBP family intramembrane metalloprotease [Prevotellaceae bacterium]|nr:CPBP family intramembrane metalloprotease [Prevotellaceae bacterium]
MLSIIFSLYHFNIKKSAQLFLMGMILSALYVLKGNIFYPIIAHFTNNLLVYAVFLKQKTIWQTYLQYGKTTL